MKQINKKTVIIGAGVAGLISALKIEDAIVIDDNPLGQISSPVSLGPRLINYDNATMTFCNNVLQRNFINNELLINEAQIGYEEDENVTNTLSYYFKMRYSEITRKTSKVEDSFLSGGKNKIEYIIADELDDTYGNISYKFIFENILNLVDKRIIKEKVINVNTQNNIVFTENYKIKYENLISTIFTNKLIEISDTRFRDHFDGIDFSLINKNFYKCKYNLDNVVLSDYFNYVYSIDGVYTRKTFFSDHIIYETENIVNENKIDGCEIEKRFENLPFQLANNYNFDSFENVFFVGRFAEWNHSVKMNEVINKVETVKEKINGQTRRNF